MSNIKIVKKKAKKKCKKSPKYLTFNRYFGLGLTYITGALTFNNS